MHGLQTRPRLILAGLMKRYAEGMESLPRRLVGLFLSYFRIAAFTLGGGMVMLPLMEDEFVRKRRWLTAGEFLDVVTLVNTLPGVIAINSSLVIGSRVAGPAGAAAACLGGLLPSIVIILLLAPLIALVRNAPAAIAAFTAVRAAVAALILLLIVRQGRKLEAAWKELAFALAALAAVRIAGVHPIIVIPVAGILGFFVYRNNDPDAADRK